MQRIADAIVFSLVFLFTLPFRILPLPAALLCGRMLARFLFLIATRHRRIVSENLEHAFPETSNEWRRKLRYRHFLYLGEMLAYAIWAARLNAEYFQEHVTFDPGSKEIEAQALTGGGGIVLICGHIGSWEMLVQYTGHVLQGGGIYKRIHNPYVDRWYRAIRERSGIQLFEVAERTAPMRYLRAGGRVGFVADQYAGAAGIRVPFLNRPASTFRGPVQLADLTGSRMLFYSCVHLPGAKLRIRIQDLGFVDKDRFPDREAAIRHYTEEWVRALERVIHDYPEQYFWVHRRWKNPR